MVQMRKFMMLAAVLLLSAGCTTPYGHYIWTGPFSVDGDMADAKAAKAPEGSFNEHLRVKYLALSEIEYAESDYADAAYYAQMAGAAGSGDTPQPAQPEGANFIEPAKSVGELQAARSRLMAALDSGARERSADHASTAQVMFDCWVEEQEENHEFDEIIVCKGAFEEAMATMAEKPKSAAEPMEPAARDYLVFFDFDKSNIRDDAAAILAKVRSAIDSLGSKKPVVLTGHTDRAGSYTYNQGLSERRAASVKAWLAGKGVSVTLTTGGKGETDLRVPTPDGVRKQENRRVEIRLD